MNNKKLIFAVSALVIAVLVIVLSEQLRKPSGKSLQFLPGLKEKDISAVEITDADGKVRVQRKGDIWVIGNEQASAASSLNPIKADSTVQPVVSTKEYQADSASVVSVIDKIVSMTITKDQKISQKPEKQSLFEVDSAKGVLVEVFDLSGNSKGSFRIGKNGPDYSSNYVRMTGSNDVYMIGGSIKYSFFTDQKRWRDKSIMKFDQNIAQGITITKKNGSKIVMAKDTATTWNIKEPLQAPVKSSELESILSSLSRFTASDFDETVASDSAAGLSKPELVVTITFSGGMSKNIIFGNKNSDNQYRLRADGKEHIYLVSEYDFNNYNKKPEELKEDPPEPADSTATAGKK